MRDRYPLSSILLHWTTAVLVVAAWILGNTLEGIPRGPARAFPAGWHILLGLSMLVLLLPRLLVRLTRGVPAPEPTAPAWEQRLAAAAHILLYVLMAAMPLTGLMMVASNQQPMSVLALFHVPNLLSGFGLRGTFELVHGVLAKALLGIVVLHLVATLWHVFVRRDGVAQRMLPGSRTREAGA